MADIKRPTDNYKAVATIGIGLIVLTFGVMGTWAAFAPLGSAVIGHGTVAATESRQTVQHLEGGIIQKIYVHEGEHVKAGQVLFELDSVQSNASLGIVKNQLYTLLARSDRLNAERNHLSNVRFSLDVLSQSSDPIVRQAITDEQSQFRERQGTVLGQVDILNARIGQYHEQIQGINLQRASMEDQVVFLNDELSGLNELYAKNLVPKSRLLALEREKSQIQGQIGRLLSDKASAEKAIGETTLQARQIRQQFDQEVARDLGEVQPQTIDLKEKLAVAQDVSKRSEVRAPLSGTVQGLRFQTEGAVVRPAETLVEIAPDQGGMMIHAQFSPNDVDSIHTGMKAELRFSTFHSRTTPVIQGTISSISQDRFVDEATHTPYFLAIVNIKDTDMPSNLKARLKAGMPAEVVVPTGERTALEYMFNPLTNALHKSMREK